MPWYVAIAEPNAVVERPKAEGREGEPQTVMERLEALGAQVFFPKARIVRPQWCQRTRRYLRATVWVPVFAPYLFASTEEPAAIRAIRGIAGLVNNADGVPGIISEELMADMRRRYRNYKIAQKLSEMPLRKGQTVRIVEGPMRGFDAEIAMVDLLKGLLTVVRDAMGREVPLTLSVEDVEVV